MSESRPTRVRPAADAVPGVLWSAALSGAVLLLYLAALCDGAAAGASADLIVKALDLEPRLSASQALWFWVTRPLAGLPHAARALNAFSAVCAALSVFFVARILLHAVRLWCEAREFEPGKGRMLAHLSALAGGAALAVSPAFFHAATRAHVGTFDALLVSVWGWLFVRFVHSPRLSRALLVAAWAGLGATQSATFLWLALPAAAGCARVLFRSSQFSAGRLAILLAAAAAAYSAGMYLQILGFIGTDGHRLTGAGSVWHTAVETLRGQYRLVRLCVTHSGWLLAFVTLVLPWAFCAGFITVSRRGRETRGRPDVSDAVGMHMAATLVTVGVLLNAPFTTWSIYGEKLPWLTPNVLSALSFGWLAAYWHQLVARAVASRRGGDSTQAVRRARAAVTAAVCVLLLGACLLSGRALLGRAAEPMKAYAEEIVRAAGGRTWLLTGGNLDSLLLVAGRERGQPLRVVNVVRMRDRLYREYVSGLFEDPQLGFACKLGFTPLAREWFGRRTNTLDRVAVVSLPDLWYAADRAPLPNVLVFTGVAEGAQPAAGDIWKTHLDGWQRLEPLLQPDASDLPAVAGFRTACRRHASLVANNLGVWLEDRGEAALAGQAYVRARRFEPYNVSALLNLGALVQRGAVTGSAAAGVRAELAQLKDANPKLDWWSLTRRYGYVRRAEAYAVMGQIWALSGQPGICAVSLRRAAGLDPDAASADKWEARRALACEQDGRAEESRALYERRLSDAPGDPLALLGLARLSLATNGVPGALALLGRLERQAELSASQRLSAAELYTRAGEWARARDLVQAVIQSDYDDLAAWAMLAGIALEQRDRAAVERCLREFLRLEKGRGFNTAVAEALVAMQAGKLDAARKLFDEALRLKPRSVETLERILRLDHLLGPRPSTADNARYLAALDGRNAMAPYTLGALHVRAGEWAAARPCLEKSVSLAPLPDALNDLAWVLLQQGDLSGAERRAREAVARGPKLAAAWDTLGVILTRADRAGEAAGALERALACGGRQPLTLAHLARVRLAQGDRPAARLLLGETKQLKRPPTPEEAAEIEAVRDLMNKKR